MELELNKVGIVHGKLVKCVEAESIIDCAGCVFYRTFDCIETDCGEIESVKHVKYIQTDELA